MPTRDRYRDYDITYVVSDVAPYRSNAAIPPLFGDIEMGDAPQRTTSYAYLMRATALRADVVRRDEDEL